MRFTVKEVASGGSIVVLAVGLAVALMKLGEVKAELIRLLGTPKDTPVVIVGGSIELRTDKSDQSGWKASGSGYIGSVFVDSEKDNAADNLTFIGFVDNPGLVTGTGGWKITFDNQDNQVPPVPVHPKPNAFSLCSDPSCVVPPSPCPTTIGNLVTVAPNPNRKEVHLGVDTYNNVKRDLHVRDWTLGCKHGAGDTDGSCDAIYQVTLTTCAPGKSGTFVCPESKDHHKRCEISIGTY
jgi:hypothetical protein